MNTPTLPYFETFSHQADIGIRGVGSTAEEAFIMAAMALSSAITAIETIQLKQSIDLVVKAPELDLLFYEWINKIIYEMDTRRMIFGQFKISIVQDTLHATITGEALDPTRHDLAVDPKGATFTELKVVYENKKWLAQCVVDV